MIDIDDKTGLFTWWYKRIDVGADWELLDKQEKKNLIKKLQQCLLDLTDLNITEKDMLALVIATDHRTVFDSVLSLWSWEKRKTIDNEYSILAYFKSTVINKWKNKNMSTIKVHKEEPVERRGRKKEYITVEQAKKYSPLRVKLCSICGKVLRSHNTTDICTSCKTKKKGKNDKVKHNNRASKTTDNKK